MASILSKEDKVFTCLKEQILEGFVVETESMNNISV